MSEACIAVVTAAIGDRPRIADTQVDYNYCNTGVRDTFKPVPLMPMHILSCIVRVQE
jgi:hypothetical protein